MLKARSRKKMKLTVLQMTISDASDNYSSNEDNAVDSGDETHDYNTYSGDETDKVQETSPHASSSSSDEGTFSEVSYGMF